jgi:mannose-6-phosphate isomerase-like protein (cupin superfamily)
MARPIRRPSAGPAARRWDSASGLSVSPTGAAAHGIEALSRDGTVLEAFVLHPAAAFSAEGHAEHAGEELFFVLHGSVELRFADRGFVLEAGDCAQFSGHRPHRIRRVGPEPASALVAVARPARTRRGKAG